MKFFKVMGPSFHRDLPPAVCKKLKNVKSRSVKLQSRLGTWKVGLCNDKDVVFFYQGWPEFVDRHDLSVGEFLIFEQTCHSQLHFNVSMFNSRWNEKEFVVVLEEEREDYDEEESPSFSKTMVSNYATNKVTVNIHMKSNNLGGQSSATLRDPRGRKWTVDLTSGSRKGKFRFRMLRGWHAFYASNALKDGDTCVFRMQRRLLIQATVFFDVQIFRAA